MSIQASGTQTAVVTKEHTLATVTDDGTYVLYVETANMVLVDELELRIKTKILSGGTTGLAQIATYIHAQGQVIKASIPLNSDQEVVFTLKQTAGTSRNFAWKVVKL